MMTLTEVSQRCPSGGVCNPPAIPEEDLHWERRCDTRVGLNDRSLEDLLLIFVPVLVVRVGREDVVGWLLTGDWTRLTVSSMSSGFTTFLQESELPPAECGVPVPAL